MKNNNAPAFPVILGEPGRPFFYKEGMSERALVAAMVMQALIGKPKDENAKSLFASSNHFENLAIKAVECADALLTELSKPQSAGQDNDDDLTF